MRRKLIGALMATFVISVVACSSAFATYTGPQWALGESWISESTTIKSTGNVTLKDTKLGIGIECKASGEGKVGPEGKGEITSLTFSSCKRTSVCSEAGVISLKTAKTPWNTELEEQATEPEPEYETSELRDKLSGVTLVAECLVLGVKTKDECTFETTSTRIENGTLNANLLFDSKSAHGNCSIGGAGTGVITGTDTDESKEGKKLFAEWFLRLVAVTTGVRRTMGPFYCEFAAGSINQTCNVEIQNHSAVEVTIKSKVLNTRGAEKYKIYSAGCVVNTTKLAPATVPGTSGGSCIDSITPNENPEATWPTGIFTVGGTASTGEPLAANVLLTVY